MYLARLKPGILELSDHIVRVGPPDFIPQPVEKAAVMDLFRNKGDTFALKFLQELPESRGILEPDSVERILLRAHAEMQRISEEFDHGPRWFAILEGLTIFLKNAGFSAPYHIVDVGCGTGYVVRYLASIKHRFSLPVELIGVDFNPALVAMAKSCASIEKLDCKFYVGDLQSFQEKPSICISTGVLHHLSSDILNLFLSAQSRTPLMFHMDFQPSPHLILGAWLFHQIRTREPLVLHDGVVSAWRAYTSGQLLQVAESVHGMNFMVGRQKFLKYIPRVFQALIGVQENISKDFFKYYAAEF